MGQWLIYKELERVNPLILNVANGREQHGITFPEKPINSHEDKLNLHEALNNQDMEYFYRKVPRYAVEHALKCSEWARC